MTKKTLMKKKVRAAGPKAAAQRALRNRVSGAVSTINTAPVAIGNSIRGSKPMVTQHANGARVVGRDFAFAIASTASTVTSWENVGGMPITPSILVSSVLRSFSQIYNKFKFVNLRFHYITSSPTSQAGDVLFYYEKDRYSPLPDYSNNNFLNYVLSDVNTIIGPQWTNHTAFVKPVQSWKTTNFAVTTDMTDDNQGSIYFFSKTSSANSPGYVMFDYEVLFEELSVSPRAGLFPIIRGMHNQICFTVTGVAVTAGSTTLTTTAYTTGKLLNGDTSAAPTGLKGGDVYKFVACVNNSTASGLNAAWTNVTTANLITGGNDVDTAVAIDDGFTCYIKFYDITAGSGITYTAGFYPTAINALAGANALTYGVTATVTWALTGWLTLVSSQSLANLQIAY